MLATRFLTSVALGVAVLSIGCGGGGSSSKNGSAAAALSTATALPEARAAHSAVLLPNGEVLVVGGVDAQGTPLRSTVLVGLTSVRPGPDLLEARTGHSATLLQSGEVLIAGGSDDAQGVSRLDTSELFDPVTETIAAGPRLAEARTRHASIAVITSQGERVLLAGGALAVPNAQGQVQLTPVGSAELVDVAAGSSAPLAAPLASPRHDAVFARLDSGRALLVSGQGSSGAVGAEIFDPAAARFTPARLVVNRAGAAVASRGREVLIAGGESAAGMESTSEVFDDATGVSAQGQRLGGSRRDATATVVGQEIVLIGGRDAAGAVAGVEKLAGAALGQVTVSALPDLSHARWSHSATAVSGKVAVVGGFDPAGVALASIEWVDLTAKRASTPAPSSTSSGITANPGLGSMPGAPGLGSAPATPATPPPAAVPPASSGSGSTSGSGSSSGGLSGFLSSLLGGGSSGGSSNILGTVLNAAISALANNQGGGFSGFLQAFLNNLLQGVLGGSAGGSSSGSGLSGLLSSLLGSLGGSGSSSGSGSGGGLSGLISSLLGALGGGSSSGSTGGSSGSGLSGLISSLLGGLTGGSSSGSTGGSSSGSGLAGLLSSLFGGSGSSGSTGGSSAAPAPAVSSMTPGQGRAGDQVTIVGQNYGSNVLVRFNGIAAQIVSAQRQANGDVVVVAVVPQGATTGMVTVETAGTTANAGVFTVI